MVAAIKSGKMQVHAFWHERSVRQTGNAKGVPGYTDLSQPYLHKIWATDAFECSIDIHVTRDTSPMALPSRRAH